MKTLIAFTGLSLMALTLVACSGDEEKTTVIHEKPVIVQPVTGGVMPGTVEQLCPNGYDNATRSCY